MLTLEKLHQTMILWKALIAKYALHIQIVGWLWYSQSFFNLLQIHEDLPYPEADVLDLES